MNINQLFDRESYTYTYLLFDSNRQAIIIDPVLEQFDRDVSIIDSFGLNLHFIVETHVHADHITSASMLKKKFAAQIAYGSQSQVEGADLLLEDGQEIKVGNINLKTIHTPGHTKGCVSLYSPEGYVFTGDTLFIKGAGRTDFQGGSTQSSYDSIKHKLYALPNETIVYPAHDYKGLTSSTIGQEKQWNDSVNETTQLEDYIKREEQKDRPYPKKFDSAVPANSYCGDQSKIIS
ncbi:MAG: MBL fold metallo-hydrolase [Candidatus Neomarinimicrobiota bacterium]|jgi:sulfur dioxygenase